MDNNYNNYNINRAAYEDGINKEEFSANYEDGAGANATHDDGNNYTKNPQKNCEQETMYNNAVGKIPWMGDAEEIEILDAIENDIAASTTDTTLYTESTGVDVCNTVVCVEIKGVGIEKPGVQDT